RLDDGINPDLEMGRYLTEHGFKSAPTLAGAIEYDRPRGEPKTLAVVHAFAPNQADALQYTREELRRDYEPAVTKKDRPALPQPPHLVALLSEDVPPPGVRDLVGAYLDAARLLGRRTAELHHMLAAGQEPDFAPEAYGTLYQRSMYQSMRNHTGKTFR